MWHIMPASTLFCDFACQWQRHSWHMWHAVKEWEKNHKPALQTYENTDCCKMLQNRSYWKNLTGHWNGKNTAENYIFRICCGLRKRHQTFIKDTSLFLQCSISLWMRLQGESGKHLSYSEMLNLTYLVKLNEFQRTERALLLCQYWKHNDLYELLIWESIPKLTQDWTD